MPRDRARRAIDEANVAEPARPAAEAPSRNVAQVLALQRSAGNAAVGRMLGPRTIQRTKEDDKLVAFGEAVMAVLDAIRKKPKKIASMRDDLSDLVARGADEGVAAGHQPLVDTLKGLLDVAEGNRPQSDVADLLDPTSRASSTRWRRPRCPLARRVGSSTIRRCRSGSSMKRPRTREKIRPGSSRA